MWPTPARSFPRTPSRVTSRPSTRIVPATGRRRPVIVSTSSPWPLSSTPATPTISPPRTRKVTAWTRDRPRATRQVGAVGGRQPAVVDDHEPLHLQQRRPGLRRLLGDAEEHVAPDHHAPVSLLRRALGRHGLDLPAAAPHADAVGDLEHLPELVRDEDDRLALAREEPEDPLKLGG